VLAHVLQQARQLSPEDRVRLIQQIVETLVPAPPCPSGPGLVYGAFRGPNLSTEEDFGLSVEPTTPKASGDGH
jgi:hypothetical protein